MTACPDSRRAERTAAALLAEATRQLQTAGAPSSARLDAELLLGQVSGWSRTEVLAHPERVLTQDQERAFVELVARRAAAEPIAYLLAEREFYGRLFKVDRRALIPRPETELLVDLGIAAVARWRAHGIEPTVLELGTGSGAVAISLAAEANVDVIATDVSFDTLALAKENAVDHGVGVAVRLLQADLLAGVRGPLHVVLGNLPYIPQARDLPADVRDYEPHVALFGGDRGTELIERLFAQAQPLLAPGAELCVELDEQEQAAPMATLARQLYGGAAEVTICQDHGGYERVVRVLTSVR
ncbi:MAG: peptide chain release factor N(5)-glutamine methyltransferase [Chloroflexi bacterium]|nr:peptide chain release factor N(5)-glutamine methyltransferase [Chloroflexota bacterium]